MLVYFGNLRVSEINRLEQIQYMAAKLVTGAQKYSSKLRFNIELGWESLQMRYDCLGLSLFHKIHLGYTRPIVKVFMPKIQLPTYNTRSSLRYIPFAFVSKHISMSFYPYVTKKWNNSHKTLQCEQDIIEYKIQL